MVLMAEKGVTWKEITKELLAEIYCHVAFITLPFTEVMREPFS